MEDELTKTNHFYLTRTILIVFWMHIHAKTSFLANCFLLNLENTSSSLVTWYPLNCAWMSNHCLQTFRIYLLRSLNSYFSTILVAFFCDILSLPFYALVLRTRDALFREQSWNISWLNESENEQFLGWEYQQLPAKVEEHRLMALPLKPGLLERSFLETNGCFGFEEL